MIFLLPLPLCIHFYFTKQQLLSNLDIWATPLSFLHGLYTAPKGNTVLKSHNLWSKNQYLIYNFLKSFFGMLLAFQKCMKLTKHLEFKGENCASLPFGLSHKVLAPHWPSPRKIYGRSVSPKSFTNRDVTQARTFFWAIHIFVSNNG